MGLFFKVDIYVVNLIIFSQPSSQKKKDKKKKRERAGSSSPEPEKAKKKSRKESQSPQKTSPTPELPEDVSTVKPEDLPEEPKVKQWLQRVEAPKDVDKEKDRRDRRDDRQQRSSKRSPVQRVDRFGLKVKGRGALRYRSESSSQSPPHWKQESVIYYTIHEI